MPQPKHRRPLAQACHRNLPRPARGPARAIGDHSSFSVRKKKFAYYLNNHHGDGIVSVCFRTERGENDVLLASDQTRFYSPAYIGPRGWVGLRLDVGKVDWSEVTDFVTDSYRLTAPKTLTTHLPLVDTAATKN